MPRVITAMPTFSNSFGPLVDAVVDATETRLTIAFPADYRQFLRTINGGCPEPNCFTVPERGPALVSILYGIRHERTPCDLEYEQLQATLWDPLPPGFVAIGDDPGGNTLLLGTAGRDAGRLFFWDRSGLWVHDDGQNTFRVADSFTGFLESLRPPPV